MEYLCEKSRQKEQTECEFVEYQSRPQVVERTYADQKSGGEVESTVDSTYVGNTDGMSDCDPKNSSTLDWLD